MPALPRVHWLVEILLSLQVACVRDEADKEWCYKHVSKRTGIVGGLCQNVLVI